MLICRAFPVMQGHCKSSGCLNYKGHIINPPHNIQKIADILPNSSKNIPLMFFSSKGKCENPKLYQLSMEKFTEPLNCLLLHNPLYKNVVIDESRF